MTRLRTARIGVVIFGVLVCAGLAAAIAVQPMLGLAATIGLAVAVVGLDINRRLGLTNVAIMFVVSVLQPLNGIRPSSSVTIGDVGLCLLAGMSIPLLRRARIETRLLVPFIGLMIITAAGFIGLIATNDWALTASQDCLPNCTTGIGGATKFILGAPGVMFIVFLIHPSPKVATVLARGYGLGSVITASAAAAGVHVDPVFLRAMGYSAHELHLALSCLFTCILAIGWFISATSWLPRLAAAGMGAICFYGMLLSGARSALIGFTVACILFAIVGRGRGIAAAAGGALALVVGLAAALPFMPQGSTIYRLLGMGSTNSYTSASNGQHVQVFNQAIDLLSAHPWTGLGFGKGLFAHNLVLEALSVGGPFALVGFVIVWGTVLTAVIRMVQNGLRREEYLAASMLIGVVGYIVLGQFENMIWDRHLWWYITLTLVALPPSALLSPKAFRQAASAQTAETGEPSAAKDPVPQHAGALEGSLSPA
ncbi:MAG TPA: O-antigen ligase family protein [Marmoricola sp.]|nr:O-antigen ligase family protein [Marmoricola sp.]